MFHKRPKPLFPHFINSQSFPSHSGKHFSLVFLFDHSHIVQHTVFHSWRGEICSFFMLRHSRGALVQIYQHCLLKDMSDPPTPTRQSLMDREKTSGAFFITLIHKSTPNSQWWCGRILSAVSAAQHQGRNVSLDKKRLIIDPQAWGGGSFALRSALLYFSNVSLLPFFIWGTSLITAEDESLHYLFFLFQLQSNQSVSLAPLSVLPTTTYVQVNTSHFWVMCFVVFIIKSNSRQI